MSGERQAAVARLVERALLGVPKTASAAEVNLRLRVQLDMSALPCSYAHYRRTVRRIQHERARWCEWEGHDTHGVRPSSHVRLRRRPRTQEKPA